VIEAEKNHQAGARGRPGVRRTRRAAAAFGDRARLQIADEVDQLIERLGEVGARAQPVLAPTLGVGHHDPRRERTEGVSRDLFEVASNSLEQ
jgi:hypothetical protein